MTDFVLIVLVGVAMDAFTSWLFG